MICIEAILMVFFKYVLNYLYWAQWAFRNRAAKVVSSNEHFFSTKNVIHLKRCNQISNDIFCQKYCRNELKRLWSVYLLVVSVICLLGHHEAGGCSSRLNAFWWKNVTGAQVSFNRTLMQFMHENTTVYFFRCLHKQCLWLSAKI